MDPLHPLAVRTDGVRQAFEPPDDGGQVAGEIGEPTGPVTVTKPFGSSRSSCVADIGDRVGLCAGGCGGQRQLHLVRGGEHLLDLGDDRPASSGTTSFGDLVAQRR